MMHFHRCYSCESEITCCCADRRANDRETGKQRRILCLWCQQLEASLRAFFKDDITLEGRSGHAEKVH